MVKICFLTDTIFSLGGIQRVVSVLANELSLEHEVHIICLSNKYDIDRNIYNLNKNINVEINKDLFKRNKMGQIFRKLLKQINGKYGFFNKESLYSLLEDIYYPQVMKKKFIEYFNRHDYDIIIGVDGRLSLLLAIISEELKSKTMGWHHNSFHAYHKSKNQYYYNQDILFKKNMPKLNGCIVLTDSDKEDYLKEFGVYCTRIYNPLSFYTDNKSSCNNKKLLYVGRIAEYQKGLDYLLKVSKDIFNKYPDWKLLIVGDGEDCNKIKKDIEFLGLKNNIEILSHTTEISKFYLESSIFLSTSRWEGFGLVITEAMECGLPVVSFKNTGPNEIINSSGVNGILVENGNLKVMKDKIMYLIENEKVRKDIGHHASIRARDFSVNSIGREWNSIFKHI